MLDPFFERQTINRNTPIPLYYQLKEILLAFVSRSASGTPLPTEKALCEHYAISRPTVRQAFLELETSGLIYRMKAKGSFVGEQKAEQEMLTKLEEFDDRMKRHGKTVRTKLLEFECVPANAAVAQKLRIIEGDEVFKIRSISYADDVPMVFILSYLPKALFAGLTLEDVSTATVHDLVEKRHHIGSSRKTFEVKPPSEFEAHRFGCDKRICVQYLETLSYSRDDVPLEYTMERYRGDKSKFVFTFTYPEA